VLPHVFASLLQALALAAALLAVAQVQADVDGERLAEELNTAYRTVVEGCGANFERPAHECSGVLVRRSSDSPEPFWLLDPLEKTLGAATAVYLRGDLGIEQLSRPHGAIFLSAAQAEQGEKPVEPLCIYPFPLSMNETWTQFGCQSPEIKATQEPDPSSCAAHGVLDAPAWVDFFRSHDTIAERQCSLSTRDAKQFNAALLAHDSMGLVWSRQATAVMVRNWDDQRAGRIPFRGLFYLDSQADALLAAQADQRRYFQHTGLWLPVLRVNLKEPNGLIFAYRPDDQLSNGFTVADRLNHRFADVAMTCPDGRPAYYCNGVLVRGTGSLTTRHAWNLQAHNIDDNVVSFSYLRRDLGIQKLFRPYGLVFKSLSEPSAHPVTLRCAYPDEAGTGGPGDDCAEAIRCDTLGITSYQKWMEVTPHPGLSCPFAPTVEQFQLSIVVRDSRPDLRDGYNEILLAAWPQDIPTQLPMEGFYYDPLGGGSLARAQFIQRDYFNETGRFLPLLRVRFESTDQFMFSYELAEQLEPGMPEDGVKQP